MVIERRNSKRNFAIINNRSKFHVIAENHTSHEPSFKKFPENNMMWWLIEEMWLLIWRCGGFIYRRCGGSLRRCGCSFGDVVGSSRRCGGSLVPHQTSGAEVPGSKSGISHNDPDALQDHCVIKKENTEGRERNLPLRQKKI